MLDFITMSRSGLVAACTIVMCGVVIPTSSASDENVPPVTISLYKSDRTGDTSGTSRRTVTQNAADFTSLVASRDDEETPTRLSVTLSLRSRSDASVVSLYQLGLHNQDGVKLATVSTQDGSVIITGTEEGASAVVCEGASGEQAVRRATFTYILPVDCLLEYEREPRLSAQSLVTDTKSGKFRRDLLPRTRSGLDLAPQG